MQEFFYILVFSFQIKNPIKKFWVPFFFFFRFEVNGPHQNLYLPVGSLTELNFLSQWVKLFKTNWFQVFYQLLNAEISEFLKESYTNKRRFTAIYFHQELFPWNSSLQEFLKMMLMKCSEHLKNIYIFFIFKLFYYYITVTKLKILGSKRLNF